MAGGSLRTLPSARSVSSRLASAVSLGRAAAVRPRAAAHVAAALRPVSLKLLSATAAAMVAATETIGGTSARLANRKLWNLTRRRRCAADLRKRRANQRTMDRPFLVVAVIGVSSVVAFVGILRRDGVLDRIGNRCRLDCRRGLRFGGLFL